MAYGSGEGNAEKLLAVDAGLRIRDRARLAHRRLPQPVFVGRETFYRHQPLFPLRLRRRAPVPLRPVALRGSDVAIVLHAVSGLRRRLSRGVASSADRVTGAADIVGAHPRRLRLLRHPTAGRKQVAGQWVICSDASVIQERHLTSACTRLATRMMSCPAQGAGGRVMRGVMPLRLGDRHVISAGENAYGKNDNVLIQRRVDFD